MDINKLLRQFNAPLENQFELIIKQLGFKLAACYQIKGQELVHYLGSSDFSSESWPAILYLNEYYTRNGRQNLPIGFQRAEFLKKQNLNWAKRVYLYFPEQDHCVSHVVFVVVPQERQRVNPHELNAGLEILSRKIIFWLDSSAHRHFIHENLLDNLSRFVAEDVGRILDHELGTHLTMIEGFSRLSAGASSLDKIEEYHLIIQQQLERAQASVEKLRQVINLATSSHQLTHRQFLEPVDIYELIEDVVAHVQKEFESRYGDARLQPKVQFIYDQMKKYELLGSRWELFRAFSEVIDNSFRYAVGGNIQINLYADNKRIIVDISHSGEGLAEGLEELIFLRFFQADRKHPGLGLGLFFARSIVEHHGGQLFYVASRMPRSKRVKPLFRFMLPVADGQHGALPEKDHQSA